ncbi:hypothetical protein [Kribbella sp. NBC_00889]|uniref:hypothetical protein n=1 Tax=Kribbella sp. NBC_00889 TaxID=2975974 RepID=UPI0038639E79|nr:hypothetical protein OG817_24155 [Kribbella sp. NBC_00889]
MAAAAMLAVFAFILTRGSAGPTTDDGLRTGAVPNGAAAPAEGGATASPDPEPSAGTAKADRKPPPSTPAPMARASTPAVNTGPTSPAFKRGQWIAVLDKYPTDVGLEADTVAKGTAAKLIAAGVPAKAMLVNGQYPGLADSSMEPMTDSWVVYLGPGSSSEQVLDVCSAPKTQKAYSNPACPTYEPAAAPGS